MDRKTKQYILLILGGILLTIYHVDIPLAKLIKDSVNQTTIDIFSKITIFGSFPAIATINVLILLYFFAKQRISKTDASKTKLMLLAILAQIFATTVIHMLKFVFGRMRPYYFLSQNVSNPFTYFNFGKDFVSFPSGHSAGVWALITCLIIIFKDNKYSPLLVIPGVLVSISRPILSMHFLSDIFVGGLLGIVLSATAMRFLIRNYLGK